ncbi:MULTISPECIES: substrate-binding periplasmic protein [unclassified Desulfovibrio]|uniref:substrate-binding periplasmic protein n=1 Tax=unclassified Desulfovibrio TaxID=2593640 RepID=UPI00163A3343|nr:MULTISPECIES: transporter substrate-binding domain-containing protein [unclassified Desulfovibrio]
MRLFLLLAILLCAAPAFGSPPLRVAVDAPYPPFAYTDESTGKLTGFDVDMAEALCRQIKRQCVIRAVPFDEIIPEIVAGNIDLGVAGMVRTPEREKSVIFTEKYFRTSTVFLGLSGKNQDGDIRGKNIAVQSSTNLEDYLKKTYARTNRIVSMKNVEEVFVAIKAGTVDLGFVDGLPAFSYLRTEAGSGLEVVGDPVSLDDGSCVVLHPSLKDLRDSLNKAILSLRASGEFQAINRKYFPVSVY